MVALIRDLFRYGAWADAALLTAVTTLPSATDDEQLRGTLHHIVLVQRFFLSLFVGAPFDAQKERTLPESFAALVLAYRNTADELAHFVTTVQEEELTARTFELPLPGGATPNLGEVLTQVTLHGQNHRGQCLTRLRQLGAVPPTLDYIIWAKHRPAPHWP